MSRSPVPDRRRLASRGAVLAVAVAAILAIVVSGSVSRRSPHESDGSAATQPSSSPHQSADRAGPAAPDDDHDDGAASGSAPFEEVFLPVPSSQAVGTYRESLMQAYLEYQEFSRYPPWSRPFDGSQQHLLDWNPPISHAQAIGRDDDGRTIRVELALDRMFAGPDEAITATATVWRDGTSSTAASAPDDAAVRGEIRVYDERAPATGYEPGWSSVQPVAFTRDAAGDRSRFRATFVPSSIAPLRAAIRDAELVAWVSAGGSVTPFSLRFRYSVESPVVVISKVADKIVNGSLEVELDVLARTKSVASLTAVLLDRDGKTPIATYEGFVRPADSTQQTIKIVFFGRVLREKGIDGPYSIHALHGHVDSAGVDQFWKSDEVLMTGPYRAKDFSDAEWKDPERDAKMSQYEQLLGSAR